MNERIKTLRKSLKMNQTDFGNKVGIKQTTVAGYENGIRTPTDAIILSICREFDINEEWLRTGKGEMKRITTEDDEFQKYIALLLRDKEDFVAQKIKRFIVGYEKLDATDKKVVENLMRQFFEGEKKSDTYSDTPVASTSVQEAEEAYIKSRLKNVRKEDLSVSNTTAENAVND